MASEIIFHTMSMTTALSPDEYYEQMSRPTIQDIFSKNPFGKLKFSLNAKYVVFKNSLQLTYLANDQLQVKEKKEKFWSWKKEGSNWVSVVVWRYEIKLGETKVRSDDKVERGGWNDLAKESVNLKSTLRKSKENKSNVD